jgi:hypothetical protein
VSGLSGWALQPPAAATLPRTRRGGASYRCSLRGLKVPYWCSNAGSLS